MSLKIFRVSRILLGLIYFVFGFNFFYNFVPVPALPEEAMPYLNGLGAAPYFYTLLKATEVACGLMLITGIWAPLALVIAAPITLQIFLFHLTYTPELNNMVLSGSMFVFHILAALEFRALYKLLFSRRWPL